jgi:hypothetical protein
MRMMAKVSIPAGAGSRAVKDGTIGKIIQQTQQRWQPEAMYFAAFDGKRAAYIVFDMPDSSGMPPFAEPFFGNLEADVEIVPVMNGEDLQKGLAQLG